MPFVRVKPDDMSQVTAVASIEEAARQVDDPDAFPPIAEMMAAQMRYGWDLDAPEHYLYIPEDALEPVGSLVLDLPTRDNLHLVWVGIVVHPDHRRHGHGSVIMKLLSTLFQVSMIPSCGSTSASQRIMSILSKRPSRWPRWWRATAVSP